ncbi:MAG: UDP-N-acetylmuramoyl-L-alanyl-D-glutamate--2,6-diaminopimelate ligase [Lachnospiraceae bacterium]|nr:UDP-N-acetylmuramoyl-L-alanyl-D-glutamate--2,6-diaminopimelate ligase [Lachnospiraceae bacterium]
MKLKKLLEQIEYKCVQGTVDVEVKNLMNDSRRVEEGSLFFCIKGAVTDGHKYVPDVVARGAKVLVVQDAPALGAEQMDAKKGRTAIPEDVTVIQVADTRYAMALMSAAYFGNPANEMRIIGLTGTKGKTTTTYMVKSILESAGYKVGLIGTIETIIGDEVIPAHNTTPESYTIQEYFRRMADAGCQVVVMEVSSQGLMLERTAGIPFEIGIFTNIEPDHIGPAEHESFEDYLECKSRLFRQCRLGILNADDAHLDEILKGHTCEVETFGLSEKAGVRAEDMRLVSRPGYLGIAYTVSWKNASQEAVSGSADDRVSGKPALEGVSDDVSGQEKTRFPVEIDIPGKFSVYNSLAAIAICRHFKVGAADICQSLKGAKVKGRVELIKVSDEFTLMIDYAHNAMALESLLETLREYRPHRLICVFGCGGNRSKLRRYEMGEVSGRLADLTVITSDNPRYEEPEAIIADIVTGMEKTDGSYLTITDRKEAIAWAIHHGEPGDIIVLAGKGHEDYQEIRGVQYPMDERVLIREILKEDGQKAAQPETPDSDDVSFTPAQRPNGGQEV